MFIINSCFESDWICLFVHYSSIQRKMALCDLAQNQGGRPFYFLASSQTTNLSDVSQPQPLFQIESKPSYSSLLTLAPRLKWHIYDRRVSRIRSLPRQGWRREGLTRCDAVVTVSVWRKQEGTWNCHHQRLTSQTCLILCTMNWSHSGFWAKEAV